MLLVVDANELFAGIITKGKGLQSWTLEILFSDKVEFSAPSRLLVELEKNKEEIRRKSNFSEGDFDIFMGIFSSSIHAIKHRRVSLHSFELRQILNLYTIYYQLSFAFYSLLCPIMPLLLFAEFLPFREHTGITKFHALNNCGCFRSYF